MEHLICKRFQNFREVIGNRSPADDACQSDHSGRAVAELRVADQGFQNTQFVEKSEKWASSLGNTWTDTLPADGNYRIRIYLKRSAARRNETANYTLSVGITGPAYAKVAGTPYHATGTVPCSVGTDPRGSAKCSFGVIRSAPGQAEVHLVSPGYDVTLHKDKIRVLRSSGGSVTNPDPKEKVPSEKQSDNWSISVNDFYYYVIPEAVINRG